MRHDHARRQSCETVIASFARGTEPASRHQPEDDREGRKRSATACERPSAQAANDPFAWPGPSSGRRTHGASGRNAPARYRPGGSPGHAANASCRRRSGRGCYVITKHGNDRVMCSPPLIPVLPTRPANPPGLASASRMQAHFGSCASSGRGPMIDKSVPERDQKGIRYPFFERETGAAPATVSGERRSSGPLGFPGKAGRRKDPRARRPADAGSYVDRAGCTGGGFGDAGRGGEVDRPAHAPLRRVPDCSPETWEQSS